MQVPKVATAVVRLTEEEYRRPQKSLLHAVEEEFGRGLRICPKHRFPSF